MPSKPMDYSKTRFYKIVCKDLNIKDCYVGHTTDLQSENRNIRTTVIVLQLVSTICQHINSFVKMAVGIIGKWY